jgi:glycosyltransferase involved in cell wall biosynthesis
MIILMHCGGMPFNGETIKNESLGGSETAAYYIARELAKRGHRVSMFTNIPPGEPYEGIFEGVKYISAGQADAQNPLGARFHFYATHTPADVCMIQRAPGAFTYRWASKINVCWLHDLALHRSKPMLAGAMWNIDSIFTVSEWHKKQVCDVYGLNPDVVRPVTNGVDLNLFAGSVRNQLSEVVSAQKFVTPFKDQIRLLYSSRPERGLEHHVRPGGIMERLWDVDKRFHLYVCAYDNKVPQMAPLYDALYERIEQLPNCTNLGALTKQELADTMRQCDALVYPTEFEEVSCITAMESMAAGLPFISSEHAALPETCKDTGALLIPVKDGKADEELFCQYVAGLTNSTVWTARAEQQREAAKRYDWSVSAEKFEKHFQELLAERQKNPETVLQSLIQVSDYYAANLYHQKHVAEISLHSPALRNSTSATPSRVTVLGRSTMKTITSTKRIAALTTVPRFLLATLASSLFLLCWPIFLLVALCLTTAALTGTTLSLWRSVFRSSSLSASTSREATSTKRAHGLPTKSSTTSLFPADIAKPTFPPLEDHYEYSVRPAKSRPTSRIH